MLHPPCACLSYLQEGPQHLLRAFAYPQFLLAISCNSLCLFDRFVVNDIHEVLL